MILLIGLIKEFEKITVTGIMTKIQPKETRLNNFTICQVLAFANTMETITVETIIEKTTIINTWVITLCLNFIPFSP